MTTQDLVNYYANLLIMQYLGKPKAYAMIQALVTPALIPQTTQETIAFGAAPTSGTFVLNYGSNASAAINWNDTAAQIQTKLWAVSGLGSVTVTGSIASQSLVVTMTGIAPVAALMTVSSNTLMASGNSVSVSVALTDLIAPLAVQNAFSLTSAVGSQLIMLGKYAGVGNTGFDFSGAVTLTDTQFRSLIQAVIARNLMASDLGSIQTFISTYFSGAFQVFDHYTMRLSYLYEVGVNTNIVAEFFIKLGLLPRPMGVNLSTLTLAYPTNNYFGCRTYFAAAPSFVAPLNSYSSYQSGRPFLSYANGIKV
jgi:hypothetical protein